MTVNTFWIFRNINFTQLQSFVHFYDHLINVNDTPNIHQCKWHSKYLSLYLIRNHLCHFLPECCSISWHINSPLHLPDTDIFLPCWFTFTPFHWIGLWFGNLFAFFISTFDYSVINFLRYVAYLNVMKDTKK